LVGTKLILSRSLSLTLKDSVHRRCILALEYRRFIKI
ncbi:hypothetical protein KPH14_011548, partial [Odynerus spinipes]